MESPSLQDLTWGVQEFAGFWLALSSNEGRKLLADLGRALQERQQQALTAKSFFYGSLVFYKDPRMETEASDNYGAYFVYSASGDAAGTLKVLQLLGYNSAQVMIHKKRPTEHLHTLQRSEQADAAAVGDVNCMDLTDTDLQLALLRMRMLRSLSRMHTRRAELEQHAVNGRFDPTAPSCDCDRCETLIDDREYAEMEVFDYKQQYLQLLTELLPTTVAAQDGAAPAAAAGGMPVAAAAAPTEAANGSAAIAAEAAATEGVAFHEEDSAHPLQQAAFEVLSPLTMPAAAADGSTEAGIGIVAAVKLEHHTQQPGHSAPPPAAAAPALAENAQHAAEALSAVKLEQDAQQQQQQQHVDHSPESPVSPDLEADIDISPPRPLTAGAAAEQAVVPASLALTPASAQMDARVSISTEPSTGICKQSTRQEVVQQLVDFPLEYLLEAHHKALLDPTTPNSAATTEVLREAIHLKQQQQAMHVPVQQLYPMAQHQQHHQQQQQPELLVNTSMRIPADGSGKLFVPAGMGAPAATMATPAAAVARAQAGYGPVLPGGTTVLPALPQGSVPGMVLPVIPEASAPLPAAVQPSAAVVSAFLPTGHLSGIPMSMPLPAAIAPGIIAPAAAGITVAKQPGYGTVGHATGGSDGLAAGSGHGPVVIVSSTAAAGSNRAVLLNPHDPRNRYLLQLQQHRQGAGQLQHVPFQEQQLQHVPIQRLQVPSQQQPMPGQHQQYGPWSKQPLPGQQQQHISGQQQQHLLATADSGPPALPSFLQQSSCCSRRIAEHIGHEPKRKQQWCKQLQQQQLQMPDISPECQLCFQDTETLVWSGEVRWSTADQQQHGSFKACGHLFPPAACFPVSGTAAAVQYWQRYNRLPAVLEFQLGTPAKTFDEAVWQAPVAAGAVAKLSDGWDLAPLALVPQSGSDLAQLGNLMQLLRGEQVTQVGGFQIARGQVQLPPSNGGSSSSLTGHTFIFHNPDGLRNKLLEMQLPEHCRQHWVLHSSSKHKRPYSQHGLLWDRQAPACLMTTCWFKAATGAAAAAVLPDAPAGIEHAHSVAEHAQQQLEVRTAQERQQLEAWWWQQQRRRSGDWQQLQAQQQQQAMPLQQSSSVSQQQHQYLQQLHQQHQMQQGSMPGSPLGQPGSPAMPTHVLQQQHGISRLSDMQTKLSDTVNVSKLLSAIQQQQQELLGSSCSMHERLQEQHSGQSSGLQQQQQQEQTINQVTTANVPGLQRLQPQHSGESSGLQPAQQQRQQQNAHGAATAAAVGIPGVQQQKQSAQLRGSIPSTPGLQPLHSQQQQQWHEQVKRVIPGMQTLHSQQQQQQELPDCQQPGIPGLQPHPPAAAAAAQGHAGSAAALASPVALTAGVIAAIDGDSDPSAAAGEGRLLLARSSSVAAAETDASAAAELQAQLSDDVAAEFAAMLTAKELLSARQAAGNNIGQLTAILQMAARMRDMQSGSDSDSDMVLDPKKALKLAIKAARAAGLQASGLGPGSGLNSHATEAVRGASAGVLQQQHSELSQSPPPAQQEPQVMSLRHQQAQQQAMVKQEEGQLQQQENAAQPPLPASLPPQEAAHLEQQQVSADPPLPDSPVPVHQEDGMGDLTELLPALPESPPPEQTAAPEQQQRTDQAVAMETTQEPVFVAALSPLSEYSDIAEGNSAAAAEVPPPAPSPPSLQATAAAAIRSGLANSTAAGKDEASPESGPMQPQPRTITWRSLRSVLAPTAAAAAAQGAWGSDHSGGTLQLIAANAATTEHIVQQAWQVLNSQVAASGQGGLQQSAAGAACDKGQLPASAAAAAAQAGAAAAMDESGQAHLKPDSYSDAEVTQQQSRQPSEKHDTAAAAAAAPAAENRAPSRLRRGRIDLSRPRSMSSSSINSSSRDTGSRSSGSRSRSRSRSVTRLRRGRSGRSRSRSLEQHKSGSSRQPSRPNSAVAARGSGLGQDLRSSNSVEACRPSSSRKTSRPHSPAPAAAAAAAAVVVARRDGAGISSRGRSRSRSAERNRSRSSKETKLQNTPPAAAAGKAAGGVGMGRIDRGRCRSDSSEHRRPSSSKQGSQSQPSPQSAAAAAAAQRPDSVSPPSTLPHHIIQDPADEHLLPFVKGHQLHSVLLQYSPSVIAQTTMGATERAELRSMALLHLVANRAAADSSLPGLPELATEPDVVLKAKVALKYLQNALPESLAPSKGAVGQFARSAHFCGLFHEADKRQIRLLPGYMRTIRRHQLLKRLLTQLVQELHKRRELHLPTGRPATAAEIGLNVSVVGDFITCKAEFKPLLLYRMLYSTLSGFVADMISGGPEMLMVHRISPPAMLLVPVACLRQPWTKAYHLVKYIPPTWPGVRMSRDLTDTGWVARV